MTTPPPLHELYELRERIIPLEYAVFEQIPATIDAMNHGVTRLYAETVANGEAIAGLRVDMAALQLSLHRDEIDLKAAMDLQADNLRKELGVATVGFRADVTGLREMVSMRLQKVDGQFKAVHAVMDQRFGAVDQRFDAVDQRFENVETQLRELRAGMDAKLDTILSELRRPAE